MVKRVVGMYFSPTGTTEKIVQELVEILAFSKFKVFTLRASMYGEITSYKVFDSACSTVSAASPETNGFDPEEPYTRTSGERISKVLKWSCR